ncbi:MAG: aminoacyl-tRNA hydrolase [Deltaproteobacteria bacterium]|nr:aminoacyl-tRNA hydrolase [Deltaproteobacteria bacterium]
MKVVLGLGNPGKKYDRTRHNLGFLVVDRLASENRIAIKKRRHGSLIGDWETNGEKVLLVKPQTYMNHSGEAVRSLFGYFPVSVKDLVVIHDDLDLPFGRIRIRQKGGAGGHRGIISILQALGDQGFLRVRVGVGRPPLGRDPTDYVLEPFSPEEEALLDGIVSRAAEAVETLLQKGPHQAMERFNRAE